MSDNNTITNYFYFDVLLISMVSIDEYVQDPMYAIDDVMIDLGNNEVHLYISEHNEAQKSIPKVIDGYMVDIIKLSS